MSERPRIAVSAPDIHEEDAQAVLQAVRSGWISSAGPQLTAFEQAWAAACGRTHGIAVSSGTTALELAIEALGIGPGDEVIIPTFTIISCALAVVRAGATPVLVDSDADTWCMSAAAVAQAITPRTRAVMPVHIYGHPCQMDVLLDLLRSRDIAILEDAAEAHGAECLVNGQWLPCGSFGNVSTFSFYANKLVTTGEGGMLVTDDDVLADRVRSSRNLGFRSDRRFMHTELAHQYRMTNLQAALGLSQMTRLQKTIHRKRAIASAYQQRLHRVPALELQQEQPWARSVYWMLGVVVHDDHPLDATALAERLSHEGIETRPFFLGMHEQPVFLDRGLFKGAHFPVAERLARRGLYLPSSTTMTDGEIARVCDVLEEALA